MKTALTIAVAALLLSGAAGAAEIKVLSTQATEEAYKELVPQFEKASGHKVTTTFTGTLGVMKRLSDGEACDLLIMSRQSIDELAQSGKVVAGSRTDIAKSGVGVAVGKGKPKPDISTVDALKKTLLAAKSIGYSTGPSGIYVVSMFQKMGIADEIKSKLKQTPTGVFVGSIIASGEAEIGFQQVSELTFFPGIDYVGPIPADVQLITVFSAGIPAGTKQPDAAKALVSFVTAPAAAAIFKKHALDPG
jgi:molybdate transport system substrate-binding protein